MSYTILYSISIYSIQMQIHLVSFSFLPERRNSLHFTGLCSQEHADLADSHHSRLSPHTLLGKTHIASFWPLFLIDLV